jgi:hypothetical protein
MKKMIVVLSLLLTVFIPRASSSQEEGTKALKDVEKREVLDVKTKLMEATQTLSLVTKDLKEVYTSMDSGQAQERFAVIHCRENVANIEGIYRYIVDSLDGFLLTKKNKVAYYGYLNEYGFEQMRRLQDQYLADIQSLCSQIPTKAIGVINKAVETIDGSSRLLDEAIAIIHEHSKQAGEGMETHRH